MTRLLLAALVASGLAAGQTQVLSVEVVGRDAAARLLRITAGNAPALEVLTAAASALETEPAPRCSARRLSARCAPARPRRTPGRSRCRSETAESCAREIAPAACC